MRATLRRVYQAVLRRVSAENRVRLEHFRAHRRWPNLQRPRTFNEKIQVRKLGLVDHRFPAYIDKIESKELVASKLGSEWIIPTLWQGSSEEEIPWDQLPLPVVLKGAHGSGFNAFVRQADDASRAEMREKARDWLDTDFSAWHGERAYAHVPRRLLIEPLLEAGPDGLNDYKFWVFGGVVRLIQVDVGRFGNHRRALYSPTWEQQSYRLEYPLPEQPVPPPASLSEMIRGAELLGDGFDFVRVDFYEVDGKPLFGEMTFTPGAGHDRFQPREADERIGALWNNEVRRR